MSDSGNYPPQDPNNPYGQAPPPQGGQYGQAPPPQGGQYGQAPPPPQGGFQGMPGMPGGPMQPAPQLTVPPSLVTAVKLMYAGAVISLIGVIASLFMTGSMRTSVEDALRNPGKTVDPSVVDSAVTAGVVIGVVVGLIGVGLWIWMARTNQAGKSWARIVATVLGGLNILFTLLGLTQSTSTAATMILNIISALLAIGILVLLWRKDSSAFYQAHSAPRH